MYIFVARRKKAVPTAVSTGLDIGLSNLSLKTITLSFYSERFATRPYHILINCADKSVDSYVQVFIARLRLGFCVSLPPRNFFHPAYRCHSPYFYGGTFDGSN